MTVLRKILPLMLLGLCACVAHKPREAALALPEPPPEKPEEVVIVRSDNPLDYRFDMDQEGRRMSADEFDAWMKARGVRVAKGAPAPAATASAPATESAAAPTKD